MALLAIQNVVASATSGLHPVFALAFNLNSLLSVAILFFVLAIVAYLLGAKGVAGMSASLGRTLLFVFLIIFLVLAVLSFFR